MKSCQDQYAWIDKWLRSKSKLVNIKKKLKKKTLEAKG